MTKLEWCRANAPKSLQSASDAELLESMATAYEMFGKGIDVEEPVVLNEINANLDSMVLVLTRVFGNKLAFKGGYMLTKMIPDLARQTADIDFSIQNSELYRELLITMEKIGEEFKKQGVIASYTIKPEVRERLSGGMSMYDATGRKILGIDVGWHNISYGTTNTNISIATVRSFTIERMLSDKIVAILSRKRFRRAKDIYDVYCISNCFDFDSKLVYEYILNRTDGVGAEWDNIPFDETVMREYRKAYNALELQSIQKGRQLDRPEFETVLDRFYVIASCVHNSSIEGRSWNHKEGVFRYEGV